MTDLMPDETTKPVEDETVVAEVEAEEPVAPRRRRGFSLTPRQAFGMIAGFLVLILLALVVYLLWFLGRPENLADRPPIAGIQAIWEVYGPGTGDRPLFDRPMGVAVGNDSRIYATDSGNNRVCAFDSSGRFLFEFGTFGIAKPAAGVAATYRPGSLNYPVGIDTDEDGNVYVASFRNDSIEVFDEDGNPLRRFPDPTQVTGRGGSGYGGYGIAVTDVAVYEDRIYATDAYQVIVFSLDGELLDQWGKPGTEPGDLDHPNGIAVGEDGTVYVSDSNHNRVTAFSPDGEVLWQVGEISGGIEDRSPREIELPRGITVLDDGSVLVTDTFAFNLVRISPEGKIVESYGERGVDPAQLNFANDVEGMRSYLVIADKENGRVQMVRLLD